MDKKVPRADTKDMRSAAIESVSQTRVSVTIPNEARPVFDWLMAYGADGLRGKQSAVLAALIRRGAEAMYQESLAEAEPLDADFATAVAESAKRAFGSIGEG